MIIFRLDTNSRNFMFISTVCEFFENLLRANCHVKNFNILTLCLRYHHV